MTTTGAPADLAVQLSDLFPLPLFDAMVDGGYIRIQKHPTLPLSIANYAEKAQYEQVWNDATLQCRGLIYDAAGTVVARPYRKFFNYGDEVNTGPLDLTAPAVVTDKLDGSLGIAYPTLDGPAIATRGSFTSDQAIHATDLLRSRYPDWQCPAGVTALFEIVYPANRIVVDYAGRDDLILHGLVSLRDGYVYQSGLGAWDWPGPIVDAFPYRTLGEALAAEPRPDVEGLVVLLGDNRMLKFKQDDYVALHRILTNTSARIIWQYLAVNECTAEGMPVKLMTRMLHLDPARITEIQVVGSDWLSKMLESVPDEFYAWVKATVENLKASVEAIMDRAARNACGFKDRFGTDRKALAQAAFAELTRNEIDLLFPIIDGRSITAQAWLKAYPGVDQPFRNRSEAVA